MASKKWSIFLCLLLVGQEFVVTRARLDDVPLRHQRLQPVESEQDLQISGLSLEPKAITFDSVLLDGVGIENKKNNSDEADDDDNKNYDDVDNDDDDVDDDDDDDNDDDGSDGDVDKEDEAAVRRADQQLAVRRAEIYDESVRREETISKRQDKRLFGAILFGISLITMFANIGLEIYLKYKGCCGIYSSICRDQRTFKRMRADLEKKSQIVDKKYAYAKDLREKVIKGNDMNSEIWRKIKEISDLQKDILIILSPSIIIKFHKVEMKIKHGVQKKNSTVLAMSYKQVEDMYQSVFDNVDTAALAIAGIAGIGLEKVASLAFKHYKTAQIAKALRTSYGTKLAKAAPKASKFFGLTKTGINAHISQTARSQFKAMYSTARTMRFVKVAGGVMSLVSIGVDIYSIYSKIKNCQIKRDRARESVRDVVKADQENNEMLAQVNEYICTLEYQGWFAVISQVRSEDLATALKDIKKLAEGASSNSPNLRIASANIVSFLREINYADKQRTLQLQRILVSGLQKVEFTVGCYLQKLMTANYCVDHCKKGQHQLATLYQRAVRLFTPNRGSCQSKAGLKYTTFKSIEELVKKAAAKDKFHVECVLNSKFFKERVCREKHNGLTADQIVAAVKPLTKSQVQFLSKDCPDMPLTPRQKQQVCLLKNKYGFSDEKVAESLGYKLDKVKGVHCPEVKELTVVEKMMVCRLRKHMKNEQIAQILKLKLDLVKKHKCK